MKNWVLLLILGVLFTPVTAVYPEGSCDDYTSINQPWRNLNWYYYSKIYDTNLVNKWWRFTGFGGDRVTSDCKSGTISSPYRINIAFSHPVNESLTPTSGTAYANVQTCTGKAVSMNVVLCPGGFYIYQPLNNPSDTSTFTYVTYHHVCNSESCGPGARCYGEGGCLCDQGYRNPFYYGDYESLQSSSDSYGCLDQDECDYSEYVCGPYTHCGNTVGGFNCTCMQGFNATDPALPATVSNSCEDIDECPNNPCGENGLCVNTVGTYDCYCNKGYEVALVPAPFCQDTDECLNETICGSDWVCVNIPGEYVCVCEMGYAPLHPDLPLNETNICLDIDECILYPTICGPDAHCNNTIGNHSCSCYIGFLLDNPEVISSVENPCTDIDECSETAGLCGTGTVCNNAGGAFSCSCPEGDFPSTGVVWEMGVTYCQSIQDILDAIVPPEGQSKERAFLGIMEKQLKENPDIVLPEATVSSSFSASMKVSGAGPQARSKRRVGNGGDKDMGGVVLGISNLLVSAMMEPTENHSNKSIHTPTVDLSLQAIGPGNDDNRSVPISANGNTMEINLYSLAKNNNGSAAAALLTLSGLEDLLSHQFFKTENQTEMYSDVITAVVPGFGHVNLSEPVNFTIQHKKTPPESSLPTCVFWEDKRQEGQTGKDEEAMRWSVDGCWVAYSDENYTVCSCSHLSTFALIMQIGEAPPENPFIEWLNRMCVFIGLFFFALAILTFLLCSWNPKINNTARIHLCLSLGLSHLLLLFNDKYVQHERACAAMAGLIHFLVVASFVWMLLEAIQLYLLVRSLSRMQIIQRDGLPRPLLYLFGYGVPFVVVGVSALVYSDGYGATDAEVCWLSRDRNFNWALTGPVIAVLALNFTLFGATLWSLRPTLASMKSDVSDSKDTRLIIFKIVSQFIILGCTWILGFYQTNLFFQVLFIILNSQQGTFLYIVHCLLNKEVREEYMKWLKWLNSKDTAEGPVKDAPSVSEDLDKM